MREDMLLLTEYAREGSNEAFRELVERHCSLVWCAAYRILGDADLARDVTQTTFTILARKAGRIPPETALAGWLYQTARLDASMMARTASRRARREQQAMQLQELNHPDPAETGAVAELLPLLDAALGDLEKADRDAVVLRFLAGRSLAEVGAALGGGENAARMRVARALDKLRASFQRRGIKGGEGLLAAALTRAGAGAAPAGLTSAIAAGALAGTAVPSSLLLLTIMKTKIILGLTAAVMAGGLVWQHQQILMARADNATLRERQWDAPPAAPAAATDPAEGRRLQGEHLELMSLRGQYRELVRLRGETERLQAENAKLKSAADNAARQKTARANPVSAPFDLSMESPAAETEIRRRVEALKALGVDARLWATGHGDQLPATLAQMGEAARGPLPPQALLDQLEFVPQPRGLTESDGPTLLMMRTKPIQLHDGRWLRSYLWADGAAENFVGVDGNFAEFETAHTAPPDNGDPASGN